MSGVIWISKGLAFSRCILCLARRICHSRITLVIYGQKF